MRLSPASFDEILRRLTADAVRLFASAGLKGPEAVLKGIGKSPEDLAMDTILKLTGGELNYHRAKGSLPAYLAKVMERDFLDLLRRKSYQTTEIVEPVATAEADEMQGRRSRRSIDTFPDEATPDWLEQISDGETKQRILSLVQGEQDLEEYVIAVLDLNARKPQDVADLLNTDTADILSRKKRLRRRLAEYFGRERR